MSATKIQTQGITDVAVTTAKIVNSAVNTSQIAADAVTTAKIVNDAVTNAKIANNAVDTSQIASEAVTTAKIANSAVDTSQIANDAITAGKLNGGQSGSAPIFGVRAWCTMTNGDNSNPNVQGNGNISSITRNGSNVYTVFFDTNMPNSNYTVALTIGSEQDHVCQVTTRNNGNFSFRCTDAGQDNNNQVTTNTVHIIVVG